jgi:hypothetical protein
MFNNPSIAIPITGIIGTVCGDVIGLPYELRDSRTKNFNFVKAERVG